MSDIGVSYDGQVAPTAIGVSIGLGFSGTSLRATVNHIDPFVVVLKPAGNVAEVILSAAAYPIAQTLGLVLPPLLTSLVGSFSFNLMTVSPISTTVFNESLTVTPANLQLKMFNGNLMVSGTIGVS